jgi:hypothetical protein
VLVCRIDDEGDTDDVTGFCYTSGGRAVPVSPRDFDIFRVLGFLRGAMAEADANRPWLAAMFRFDRSAGKVTAEFEYDRSERWAVTPQNVKARALEFAQS